MLLFAVVVRLPTLGQQLIEIHAHRQTQTAYTAVLFARDGIDLLHPKLPILGPPWEVPFEFPIFQAIGAIPIAAGVPAEIALRATCLLTFLLTAVLLWSILARHVGRVAADSALFAFLFSPLSMLWSRTSSIEYLATTAALLFVMGALEWRSIGRARWWWVAFAGACLAMLVKPTTGVFYLVPALFLLPARSRPVATFTLIGLPLLLGLAWTAHADAIKSASSYASALTSRALLEWNFGTLEQRLDPAAWAVVLVRFLVLIGGLAFVPLVLRARRVPLILTVHRVKLGALAAWLAIAAVLPVLVFFNLYVVHDYYLVAISPACAALLGIGVAAARDRRSRVAAIVAIGIVAAIATPYWAIAYDAGYDPERIRPQAQLITSATAPDDLVAIKDYDWSPALLYLADRRGLMVAPWVRNPDLAGYRVFSCRSGEGQCTEEP